MIVPRSGYARLLAGLCLAFLVPATEGADTSWHEMAGARWRLLEVAPGGRPGFERLTAALTGVAFTNALAEQQGATNRVLWNGSGVAAGDYNGDGLPDLFLCALNRTNALYENLGGWRFRETTQPAGLVRPSRFDRGAVLADVSGDGALDLLIATTGGGVLCYLGDGAGRFRDVSRVVGTLSPYGAMTLALADLNGDRFLDLYVCNYRVDDIKDRGRIELPTKDGRVVIPPALADRLTIQNGQLLQYGEPDLLYLNNGTNGFQPVSWTGGTFLDEDGRPRRAAPLDWGLTATFRDLNDDGFPDLYVCNDFWTPDRIWFGNGKDRLQAIAPLAMRQMSGSSMGIDVADLDRDGHMDFLVLEMLGRTPAMRKRQLLPTQPESSGIGVVTNRPQVLRNTLFRNRGDGTFAELARFSGLAASDWSWSPVFLDVDLDGYEDVLITAGHVHDLLDADAWEQIRARDAGASPTLQTRIENDRLFPRLLQPIVAFRNLGDWRFEDTTAVWGTDHPGVHHAIATADFDQDGDLDFVANALNGGAAFYRNLSSAPRVAVRLRGRNPNMQGIGAKVSLHGGAVPVQTQEVVSGGRYLAGSDPQLAFAAGRATGGMKLEVVWRTGRRSVVPDVDPNRLYEIREPEFEESVAASLPRAAASTTLFRDVSSLLDHVHRDEPFDDFERQPLLPRKLSQLGPGVAWFDLDGDRRDDLLVATGKGGRTAVRLNRGRDRFVASELPALKPATSRDQTTILGWQRSLQERALLIGLSHHEDGQPTGAAVITCDAAASTAVAALPVSGSSSGPLALADIDGDGLCDLFVGGRSIPGRYPEPASSGLYRFRGNQWWPDAAAGQLLVNVGMVSAAVWTDLEADGFPELVLACDWGPLRVFRNRGGVLEAWDPGVTLDPRPQGEGDTAASFAEIGTTVRLSELSGWWNGVSAGDFDNDGRLDLVAANWGLNSEYVASPARPLRLYYGKFSSQVGLDLIETEWDPASGVLTPSRRRDELSAALPWLAAQFPTHRAYSEATLSEVLGAHTNGIQFVSATTLASTVFLNRGDRFQIVPLPAEAQWAPAFGVCVADADGDGNEDVFLAQNFFATRPDVSRLDAGRGLWLLGNGAGGFRPLSAAESGISVDGEGRGAAVSDFNEDGRVDLAVAQHGGATRLFENQGAEPGLRVQLEGPSGNPSGSGAVMRWRAADRLGPAREVHAGSGYWSQDGAIQVLGLRGAPTALEVRWPGGRTTLTPVESGASLVRIRFPGSSDAK